MLTISRKISVFLALAFLAQQVPALATQSDAGPIRCIGTKKIGDTVGITTDRKTGAREQSLVQARLAFVSKERVVGTVYVDDQGMRYVQLRGGPVMPLPPKNMFDGKARLSACT
jgi:hypothetical protein